MISRPLAFLAVLVLTLGLRPSAAGELPGKFKILREGIRVLKRGYVDRTKVRSSRLEFAAVKGMVLAVDRTGECWSDLPPLHPGTVGVIPGWRDDRYVVMSVEAGSAAFRAGVRPHDFIFEIGKMKMRAGYAMSDLVRMFDGPVGTTLAVKLGRTRRSTALELTLVRHARLPAVTLTLHEHLAVVTMRRFHGPSAVRALRGAVAQEQDVVRALLLDLRGCWGGSLTGLRMVGGVLIKDQLLATIQKKEGDPVKVFSASQWALPASIPLWVLVDQGTSGMAEVLAAALQDHARAVVMGAGSTAGQGRHQERFTLEDGTVLQLTTGWFRSPKGVRLMGKGVTPDILRPDEKEWEQYAGTLIDMMERISP